MVEQDQKLAGCEPLAAKPEPAARHGRRRRNAAARRVRFLGNSRGVVAMEFAILSVPFLVLVLGVMEISYDLFTQSALDVALFRAVRSLQVGSAQNLGSNAAGGAAASNQQFITGYLCPSMGGMLECGPNVFVKVQPFAANTADYWDLTKPGVGGIPMSGNSFNASSYISSTSFCNVQKQQFILVSAIYLGPTFVGGLLPNVFSLNYLGHTYHATLSTLGVATEQFSTRPAGAGATVLPPC